MNKRLVLVFEEEEGRRRGKEKEEEEKELLCIENAQGGLEQLPSLLRYRVHGHFDV